MLDKYAIHNTTTNTVPCFCWDYEEATEMLNIYQETEEGNFEIKKTEDLFSKDGYVTVGEPQITAQGMKEINFTEQEAFYIKQALELEMEKGGLDTTTQMVFNSIINKLNDE